MKNLIFIILFFCFAVVKSFAQEEESCSYEAEQAWEGDSSALNKFLSTCGRIDTSNFDASNKNTKGKANYQTIRMVLNSGKVLKTDSVFFIAAQMPEFPGKEMGLVKYLSSSIHYPSDASKNKVHGIVYVSLIIERDGSVSHTKIKHGIGYGCDQEALNLINRMPKWNPGKNNNKPVRVQLTVPVKFSLDK